MKGKTMDFPGFEPPKENWSKLPHELINYLHLMTGESEVKVVLYILRHTWGYHDDQKKITIDEFCNGRKRKDGSRIDRGTGLSENAIRAGIENATKHGFIEVSEDATDKARIKRYYQLKGSNSGVQKLNPRPSKVEPLDSEVEPRSEKDTYKKKLEEEGPLTKNLISLCQIDTDMMSQYKKGSLLATIAILVKKNVTADDLIRFKEFWFTNWRSKDGSPPTPQQVCDCWGEFKQWNPNGKVETPKRMRITAI